MEGEGGDLYTGVNRPIVTDDTQSDAVKREIKKNRELLAQLVPTAEAIVGIINQERDSVRDIRTYMSLNLKNEKEIMIEYRARELYMDFLNDLETNIKDRLRTAATRQEPKKRII